MSAPIRSGRSWTTRGLIAASLGTTAMGLGAPLLSGHNAFFDLCSDLRFSWLTLTVVASVLLAFGRRWIAAGLTLVLAAFQFVPLIEWYTDRPAIRSGQPLTVLSLNVHWNHQNLEQVIRLLEARQPDVFVAQELTEPWVDGLERIRKLYPYHQARPRYQGWGLGIYSKRPITLVPVADRELRIHILPVDIDDACVRLVAVHTYRTKPMQMESRNRQLGKLAREVQRYEGAVVLAGDFNVSPFSVHYRRFVEEAGVIDTRRGFGLAATYPLPGPFPGAILDHVLVSEGIGVRNFEVGPDAGSDHRPLWVEMTLPGWANPETGSAWANPVPGSAWTHPVPGSAWAHPVPGAGCPTPASSPAG